MSPPDKIFFIDHSFLLSKEFRTLFRVLFKNPFLVLICISFLVLFNFQGTLASAAPRRVSLINIPQQNSLVKSFFNLF